MRPTSLALLLALIYLFMSLLTYAVYAADKAAAHRGRQRVSERTLHQLALLGGWPGAFLAQRHLRHKTRKPGFLRVFRLTVLLHLAVLLLLSVPLAATLM